MVCPRCSAQVAAGSRYCLSCGFPLTGETQAAESPRPPLPWSPYPGSNTPTTPPDGADAHGQPQGYGYSPYTPYPEHPATSQLEGTTWPGTTPPPFGPAGQYAPGPTPRRGSAWQRYVSVAAVALVIGAMLFVWLNAHRGPAQQPPAAARTTQAASATATATPVPSACQRLSNFIGAHTATITPMFSRDIAFPPASLSYLGDSFTDGSYRYNLVDVCSSGMTADGVRAFFAQALPQSGWEQSANFPYHGDPSRACGDPYCWQNGSSPGQLISLEQAQTVSNGAATTYVLRLAQYTG